MKTRILLAILLGLFAALPAAAQTEGLDPIDYAAYYRNLEKMKEISDQSMESIRKLHKLMKALEQTDPKDEATAAGIRAQIRPVLEEHRKLKVRMIELVDIALKKGKPERTDKDALRALRNKTLHRVSWNNIFLKYVARDIAQAIGVPIRLNAKVQELNQVEINFPEISAEGVMTLICQNFDLKWIIYGGEFIVLKKIGPNEERFIAWEKKHGKVDWIAEDEAGTYEDIEVKAAKRKLKKLEDMNLPLLEQSMTKLYILEGESKRHEMRLKELEVHAKMLEVVGDPKFKAEARKRHKHTLHYLYMERENAIEVWDVINKVLGDVLRLEDDNEELRKLLAKEIKSIEWKGKDLEDALYELGRMVGVPVEVDLPPFLEMSVNLSVENVTVETVINLLCDIHPMDWRYVNGRLFFAHLAKDD